jgi:D-arabinose 1-dehydrogenase-like Zn-dependent alcohol dehydrogenase
LPLTPRPSAVSARHRQLPRQPRLGAAGSRWRGVGIVVETVGETLTRPLTALTFCGFIRVIGFVGGYTASMDIRQLIGPMARIQGIAVGSRARAMNALSPVMALPK